MEIKQQEDKVGAVETKRFTKDEEEQIRKECAEHEGCEGCKAYDEKNCECGLNNSDGDMLPAFPMLPQLVVRLALLVIAVLLVLVFKNAIVG